MIYKNFLISAILISLTSCTLGVSSIKADFPEESEFINESGSEPSKKITLNPEPKVVITTEWIGNSLPMATSKSILGLTNRFVIPYTRQTSIFNFIITNNSNEEISFNTKDIKLITYPDKKSFTPLETEYFKNRWPTFAVKNSDMLIDQSIAIGEVIRTIIRDRIIEPDSSYHGYIPFYRINQNVLSLEITGKIKIGEKESTISFKFKKV